MDEFEKEYFSKLKQIIADYQPVRRDLAKSRIKMFVAAVYRQLIDNHDKFDLIIAAGNSGLYMSTIIKMAYDSLRLDSPKIITLPIFRFKADGEGKISLNDNSPCSKLLLGKLKDIPKKANVLFIDDEIMRGLTVKTILELILNERPDLVSLRCVIIAENHFFEWHYHIPKVSVNFFAYSRLIQGLNGNIGYFIPEDLFLNIKAQIPDVESYNHSMAIVIGGALKRKNENNLAFYDSSVEDSCKQNIPNYSEIRDNLLSELKGLVSQGIAEYENKTIQFRF